MQFSMNVAESFQVPSAETVIARLLPIIRPTAFRAVGMLEEAMRENLFDQSEFPLSDLRCVLPAPASETSRLNSFETMVRKGLIHQIETAVLTQSPNHPQWQTIAQTVFEKCWDEGRDVVEAHFLEKAPGKLDWQGRTYDVLTSDNLEPVNAATHLLETRSAFFDDPLPKYVM